MQTENQRLVIRTIAILLSLVLSLGMNVSAFGEKGTDSVGPDIEPAPGRELTGNNSASFERSRASLSPAELSFNGYYVANHFDKRYVDKVDQGAFRVPMTYARSNAAYTRRSGTALVEGPGHSNVIAGMNYYTLIYDVDPESDYCVALPDVNMGNKALSPYAVDVVYNNNANETLKDVHYDRKDSILYIARKYLEDPDSEEPLFDKKATVAIQTSYKMPDRMTEQGDPDYGKKVPVMVFSSEQSSRSYGFKDVKINNMLDVTTLLPGVVNDPSSYKQEDFHITLNGTFAALSEGQFSYDQDTGSIRIAESPAVISSITIMVERKNTLAVLRDKTSRALGDLYAYAADTTTFKDMKALKTSSGKKIFIADDDGDIYEQMYLGWRGSYKSKDVSGKSMKYNVHTDELIDACGGKNSFFTNSMQYLHAASSKSAGWAILSYAIGNDATKHPSEAGSLGIGKDKKIEIPKEDGKGDPLSKYGGIDGSKTLYEWMDYYRNHLLSFASTSKEDADGSHYQTQFKNSDGQRNGAITFAFQFPEHIDGEPSLVDSDTNASNAKKGFDSTKKISVDIRTDELDQDKTNLWLAGWCRHMDDGKTKDDGDTVYVSCIGKGTDETGRYVVLAWSSAGAYSKYEQTGGAVYKLYVEDVCGKCTLSKTTAFAWDETGKTMTEKGAVFRVWNKKYATYEAAASHGSKYAQTLTQQGDSVTSGDLVRGDYQIEQTSAGDKKGVSRLMSPFSFKITAGSTVVLTGMGASSGSTKSIVNDRYDVDLILQKRSDDRVLGHFENDTLLSDQITFEIASVDSSEHGTTAGFLQTVTTDKEGKAEVKGLQAGYYRITEKTTQEGYYLPEDKASITVEVGIDGKVRKLSEIGEDAYALTEVSDSKPSSDPSKVYQITWSKNNTPQNTVLSLTKHRCFVNEAEKTEQQPQGGVEFNLYAKGDICSYDGHGDHVYYKDGTLIQGMLIDNETGARTCYVDGHETTEEKYRIITDEKGNWSSEDTDWKVYPLTGKDGAYEMREAYIWEQGDHISFSEEEKHRLTKQWTEDLDRSATDKLKGAGEITFQQVMNHGVDLSYRELADGTVNTDQKSRLSSAGYLIDDQMLRKFISDRIVSHIKSGSDVIANGESVGTIARDVRILSPSEAADISKVRDEFQVKPFDSDSLTTEHVSAFVNDQVPSMITSAESKKGNLIPEKGKVTITDTISYANLFPGIPYTIRGTLYDKGTGKLIKRDGKPYTVEKTFTPQRRTGKKHVTFTLDGAEAVGDLVAFEEVRANGTLMMAHVDPSAAAQTVHKQSAKKTKTKKKPAVTRKGEPKPKKKGGGRYAPETGDTSQFGIYLGLLAATSILLMLTLIAYYYRYYNRKPRRPTRRY